MFLFFILTNLQNMYLSSSSHHVSSDDLVISAPMYSDHEKNIVAGWEVGAIQIYYNDNQVYK